MASQFTLGAAPIQDFQPLDSALLVCHQVFVQRGLADADKLRDLGMRQSVTLQPQCLHPLLDARMGMVKAFVMKRLFFLVAESNLKHGEKPKRTPCFDMADPFYIVIL